MSEEILNEEDGERLTKAERKLQRREEREKVRQQEEKQRKTKIIVKWVAVFVGLLLVIGFISFRFSAGGESDKSSFVDLEITETDWVKGNRDARVMLIEYADFQCPACATYSPIIKQLNEEYGDKIGVVFRHFPLKQLHANAESVAIAAEAAGQQGKFWEMHDLLFERQDEWSNSDDINSVVEGYSQELELDVDRFMQDLESDTAAEKVDSHYKGGASLGVNSTPTFFLNGQKLDSVRSYDQFKEAIEEAISNGS